MHQSARSMKSIRTVAAACLAAGVLWSEAEPVAAQSAASLDQGWTDSDRSFFYRTSQGSRLMPYALFVKIGRAHV